MLQIDNGLPNLQPCVQSIEVYHAEIVDGVKTQKITIYYNCIGSIEIPEELPIAAPEITLQTRKGVTVSYQSNALVAAV